MRRETAAVPRLYSVVEMLAPEPRLVRSTVSKTRHWLTRLPVGTRGMVQSAVPGRRKSPPGAPSAN